MKKTGFTLIELLIVIALLGALAVGLLAAIDPFEQLKKGRDTSTRNTVSEFYNANLRYFATKGHFPWGSSVQTATAIGKMDTYVNMLQDAGELKTNFLSLAQGATASILVSSTGGEDIHVCFDPESKGFSIDPNTVFNSSGGSGTSCRASGGSSDSSDTCYYCIQ